MTEHTEHPLEWKRRDLYLRVHEKARDIAAAEPDDYSTISYCLGYLSALTEKISDINFEIEGR